MLDTMAPRLMQLSINVAQYENGSRFLPVFSETKQYETYTEVYSKYFRN